MFAACLSGDVEVVRANLSDRDEQTPEGYTPLSLAVSAGHNAVVRLLLREGANPNASDGQGVTALMHAAMHGYAELIDLLLLHGAKPMQLQHDGRAAPGLAALFGRPAALGAFLRADPALLSAVDGRGRTLLHWAVASQHIVSLKYLLGRWGAATLLETVDAAGDAPLHVCRGPADVLLLLYHCGPQRPSLSTRNHAGHTAAEAACAAECSDVATMLQAAGGGGGCGEGGCGEGGCGAAAPAVWLEIGARSAEVTPLFSFLCDSRARVPPARVPRGAWCHALGGGTLLRGVALFGLQLLLCTSPATGLRACMATVLLLLLARIAGGCVGGSARAQLALRRCGCGVAREGGGVRGAPSPMPPLLLLLCVMVLLGLHAALLLPATLSARPLLGVASLAAEAVLVASYLKLLVTDPGMVPGGNPADAAQYWDTLERMPPGAPLPESFCSRSELLRPPRARFSGMSGGMVRVMDHDCAWVGCCIGEGNHRAFMAMAISGELALLLCAHELLHHLAQRGGALRLLRLTLASPHATAAVVVHARLLLLMALLCALLLLLLTPLLLSQASLVAYNLTTVEFLRAMRTQDLDRGAPHTSGCKCHLPPFCRSHTAEYAPHSRGLLRNVLAFAMAQRSVALAAVVPAPDTSK